MLWETVKLAIQSVRRNVLRSVLTLLGIVIGVAAVIAMVTIGTGTTRKVTEELTKLGSNMLIARPGQNIFGPGGAGSEARSFQERDIAILRANLGNVRAIAPAAVKQVTAVRGPENYNTSVTGTDTEFFTVQDWSFKSGRPFAAGETRSGAAVCVIGETVHREIGQKPVDLRFSHLDRMPLAVEEDEAPDPRDVRLLGPQAVVAHAHGEANAVEKTRLARARVGRGRPGGGRTHVASSPLSLSRAERTGGAQSTQRSRSREPLLDLVANG
jgi:hypothetical protein